MLDALPANRFALKSRSLRRPDQQSPRLYVAFPKFMACMNSRWERLALRRWQRELAADGRVVTFRVVADSYLLMAAWPSLRPTQKAKS